MGQTIRPPQKPAEEGDVVELTLAGSASQLEWCSSVAVLIS